MTSAVVTTFTPASYVRRLEYYPLVPDVNCELEKTCHGVYMFDGTFTDTRPYSSLLEPPKWKSHRRPRKYGRVSYSFR